jgi:uncharacterized protein (UPF0332 family)
MTLNKENRNAVVEHRLQKAKETLSEAKGNVEMGFWHTAANRLYYACYYAVTALLIKNGYSTHTHHGVFTLLGKHFVLEGIITSTQNKLYGTLLELRQNGDYNDWISIKENDVKPLVEPAKSFIAEIEKLIYKTS